MTTIADRYQLDERIGAGAMGQVYTALDAQTGLTIAIKHLKPEVVARDPEVLDRFQREGEILRSLDHPNIVSLLNVIEQDGEHYIVMEYVPGGTLRDLLKAHPHGLERDQVLSLALEVADALARAHHLSIIHRDLKPENVLLAEDGTPRLTDFGLARILDRATLTEAGTIFGTWAYISPEAYQGSPLDERSDIWSFGVLLYELLTGQWPFEGSDPPSLMRAVLHDPIPDLARLLPDSPDALIDLLRRMLVRDRDARTPSMRLVGAELEALLKGASLSPTEEFGFPHTATGQKTVDPITPQPGSRAGVPSPPVEKPGSRSFLARWGPIGAGILLAGSVTASILLLSNLPSSNTDDPQVPSTAVPTGPVPSPAPTLNSTQAPLRQAEQGVSANADWQPVFRTYNGHELALVPAGCFMMGSNDRPSEQPIHEVCVDEPFWIDVFEVTNHQYGSEGLTGGPSKPRDYLDWYEASEYCASVGGRLPNEAEWEYAARGPDSLIYPWGNETDRNKLASADNAFGETVEVGSYPAGASWVGAQDMAGNILEWTSSIYMPYPFDPTDGREEPSNTLGERVFRGGGVEDPSSAITTALRYWTPPSSADNFRFVGVRCAFPSDLQLPPLSLDGEWQRAGTMDTGRYMLSAAVIDGRVLIPGGASGEVTLDAYDPAAGTWEELSNLPEERLLHMAAAYDGKLYLFGGVPIIYHYTGSPAAWVYDPARDAWSAIADMPEGRWGGAAVTVGNYIYIVGGSGDTADILRYDPIADVWDRLAPLDSIRWGMAAAAVDNQIYVLGGTEKVMGQFSSATSLQEWSEIPVLDAVAIYDTVTDSWSAATPMPEGRYGHSAAAYGPQIVILGGGGTSGDYLTRVDVLDTRSQTWHQTPEISVANGWGDSVVVSESIYYFGGTTRVVGRNFSGRAHGRILVYHP